VAFLKRLALVHVQRFSSHFQPKSVLNPAQQERPLQLSAPLLHLITTSLAISYP